MKIVHICNGWETSNGAAVVARFIMEEQKVAGHEVICARWAGIRQLREADEVWIHCGWMPCLVWASLWARRSVRMPAACYDPKRLTYHGWKKRLVGPIERWALRRAKRVVATCAAEAEWIKAYEPRVKAVVVTDIKRFFKLLVNCPCSLDASNHKPRTIDHESRTTNHVLYLGRRHPLKGVEYLERAVDELNRDEAKIELRIVSNAFGEEKEKVWEWCDVLVLPTLSDNFGLVVAEALERGKRVVTTDGAPAWEPEKSLDISHWSGGGRLLYLRGFRDGTGEERVRLLKEALNE